MKTTLNQIRHCHPCKAGWEKLLRSLDKTAGDDEPLSLLTVLDSNGVEDAIWCFRAVAGFEKEKRLFAIWCARQVQHLAQDARSVRALDVAEAYANGQATREELHDAHAAAAAAHAAAEAAAHAAAIYAAATYAAAAYAAEAAAEAAAYATAHAAAYAATYAATYAAEAEAEAAEAEAAEAAGRKAQADQLRKMLLALEA